MELSEYNGFGDHCKNSEVDLKEKFVEKGSHNIGTMEQIMHRKDQEFIDQALLAPEYMRDPNHFIMDLINFPKAENDTHNNGDNLQTDLNFPNSLFPVTSDDHQHTNGQRKTPPNSVFMPLNNDFLMPVQKSYNTAVTSVNTTDEDSGVKVVQQLLLTDSSVTLDDAAIDDACDISRFNSRKVLPHKKRISRKLKLNHCDSEIQLNVPLNDHKLPLVDQLVVGGGSIQQFRCEICGHTTCSQLEFFAHLKQHYEPSTPDTILASMKTSLDALGPQKTEEDLCAIKKTDGLDQVFQDVHFPFENFSQGTEVVSVRVIMEPQHHQHETDRLAEATMNVATSTLQQHRQARQQQPQQHQHQRQQQPTASNLVSEEFSDTEDMLEGIRDKVLIEDTCDTMDLMTQNSNGVKPHWFTSNCFTGIDLKPKPFCDVLFSGQFAPILTNDATVPLMQPEPHMTTGKVMHRELEPNSPGLQPPAPPPPPLLTQPVQSDTNLRLQFTHTHSSLHNNEHCFVQNQHQPHQISETHIMHVQHIKVEDTPPSVSEIPYPNSEDTISGSELEPEHDFNQENDETDDEYNIQLDQKEQIESSYCEESVLDDKGEEICSRNDHNNENNKRKRYVCNKCQRIFNSCNALKYHSRTHSGLRPHQCDICDKSFFAVGALKAHTRTHTGDKPFECEHCERKFRQWGDLKYHTISIHSTEKNHQCEFCGKAFSRKYSLVVHLRIHTSERNYKCEFCTKTFRASTYLQNHRKIHTGEKPYECDYCSKRFRVSGDLRRHQRIHERKQQKHENSKKNKEESGV